MSLANYSLTDNVSGMAYTSKADGAELQRLMYRQPICFLTQKLLPGESVIAMLGAVLDQAKEHNVTVFTGSPLDGVLLDNRHGRMMDIRTEPSWGDQGVHGDTLAFVTPMPLQTLTFKLACEFREQKPNRPVFMETQTMQDYLYVLRSFLSFCDESRREVLKSLYTNTVFIDVERLHTKPIQGMPKPCWQDVLYG